jgi:nitrile hydratase accessory protein
LSGRDAGALSAVASIPRDADGPIFPAPWAARAFALAVALNERGVFAWREWSEALGAAIARDASSDPTDPEAYWRSWLAALEDILAKKQLTAAADLAPLQAAWRRAAEATPHGQAIKLHAGERTQRQLR